jgi:outer membrane receptor for ferrienterochelin and colicin
MSFAPPVRFAVLDSSSGFYSQYNQYGIVTLVEDPIGAHQISGFYELNYLPAENTTILFSGRIDKHNLAKVAFSPRIAIIQQINKNNFLKLIAQQSVRLPNFRELYALDFASEPSPSPETLRGIELIYSSILWHDFSLNVSAFYQSVNQIGWTDNARSEVIGEFNTAGFETDLSYKLNNFNIALNYTYIKQLEWNPEYGFDAYLSNIGVDSLDIPLVDAGNNRINNFPQHQLKLITSYKFNKSFYVHFNARFASKYGQVDMLDMFRSVHDKYGDTGTQQEMSNIYDDVTNKGYAQPSFTSNISVSYNFNLGDVKLVLSSWVMNLVSVNHIRYVYQYWEEGNNWQYPRQVGFVEEPRTFGLRLTAGF